MTETIITLIICLSCLFWYDNLKDRQAIEREQQRLEEIRIEEMRNNYKIKTDKVRNQYNKLDGQKTHRNSIGDQNDVKTDSDRFIKN